MANICSGILHNRFPKGLSPNLSLLGGDNRSPGIRGVIGLDLGNDGRMAFPRRTSLDQHIGGFLTESDELASYYSVNRPRNRQLL